MAYKGLPDVWFLIACLAIDYIGKCWTNDIFMKNTHAKDWQKYLMFKEVQTNTGQGKEFLA